MKSSAPGSPGAVGGGDVVSAGGNEDVASDPGGSPSLAGSAGSLSEYSCEGNPFGGSPAEVPSFYETNVCMRRIAPGCPTADPWNAAGHWWYLQPDGENIDLVLCAPECASPALKDGGCLYLSGPLPTP